MGRRPRAAAQAAAASLRTPTPHVTEAEASDDEMPDAPASNASTPQVDEAPAQESEAASEPSTPAPANEYPRKRRLGRPPKVKPPDWDAGEDRGGDDGGSEAGTPFKKRRGRPSAAGGGRWGKAKGGPSHVTQVPIDKEGNMMDVIDDEVAMPEDAEGETKVDKLGYLQGGREYRCRTFTILGRKGRLYMLSTEPARCIGFRDSYLFFQKHKQLYKIIIDEPAKRDLIDRELIPHSYKGRAIGVVTARSVFREFGARIVVGGRKVIDDYHGDAARQHGDIAGELADPHDRLPKPGEKYNQNQYVAWHGASSVYHSGAPSVPAPSGKSLEAKKRKVVVTDVNWMLEHAREASRFNTLMVAARRENLDGVYDPHTNLVQYPKIIQPTHARWEPVPEDSTSIGATTSANGVVSNGVSTSTESHGHDSRGNKATHSTALFPPIPARYRRSFLIADTHFISPARTGVGIPGPDGDELDLGPPGLMDVSDDVVATLPPSCRAAFEDARQQEQAWKRSWRSEREDGAHGRLKIGF